MRINWKFVSFICCSIIIVISLERFINILYILLADLIISPKIIDRLFPKDLNVVRVRYPNEIQTDANNVTILDFVSVIVF